MTTTLPLAITMGDASGIGPEIVAKTLAGSDLHAVVFGSHLVMADIVNRLGIDATVRRIADPEATQPRAGVIEVVEATRIVELPPIGRISAVSGQASFDAIVAAIAAAKIRQGRRASSPRRSTRRPWPAPGSAIPATPRSWPTTAAPNASR